MDDYVPGRTRELLSLLDYPAAGHFRNQTKNDLTNWQCCVRSYDDYVRQRDKLPPR